MQYQLTVELSKEVSSNEIIIRRDSDNKTETHKLLKFKRSNQGTTINQRPIVLVGEKVEKNQVIADGRSTELGENSLEGKNLLIAFMTWEGYNFEDAILISEKLVVDDT